MKQNTPLTKLIRDITRLCDEGNIKATILRENNIPGVSKDILKSFTPKNMVRPFKDLPNVSGLWIRPNVLDPLLSDHGLASKLAPDMSYEEYSWRTKAANRYLRIMYYRMEKLLTAGSHDRYWLFALMLMNKSKVIRACALRKLDRNWHRNFKFGLVKTLLAKLDILLQNVEERITIQRTYAVKSVDATGKVTNWRPIGNPAYADRMYLYIWQSFFVIYVNSFIDKDQHAYRPNQGVATCLKAVKGMVEDKENRNIYEFDLKGAFPSVSVKATAEALTASGFPAPLGDFLLNMSSKTIEMVNRSKQKLPEQKFDRQENIHRGLIGGFDQLNPLIEEAKKNSLVGIMFPIRNAIGFDEELAELIKKTNTRWGFERFARAFQDVVGSLPVSILEPNEEEIPMHLRGFPQGSAWSPVLFNYAFEYAALRGHFRSLDPKIKLISYADDFLTASKDKIMGLMDSSPIMAKFGFTINTEKSRPLKVDGYWVVSSFKFLGVTFHVSNDKPIIVEGTPRSGATLEFDKFEMVEKYKARDKQLRLIGKALNPENPIGPQELLDTWGKGERPGNLIPLSIIKAESKVKKSLLNRLREVARSLPQSKVETASFSVSETNLFSKIRDGSSLNWLGIRKAGLLLNRLHGGSWSPLEAPASRSLSSPPSTKGRSLLELNKAAGERFVEAFGNSFKARALSIWNSTSMATKISLNLLRKPKSVKVRHSRITTR